MEAGRSPTGRRGRVLPRVKASAQRTIVRWGCRRGSSGRAGLRLVAGTAGSAGRGSLQTAVYKRRVAVYKRGSLQTCQFASVAVYKRGSLQTARGSLQTWQFTNGAWQFTNGAWQFTNVAVYKRGWSFHPRWWQFTTKVQRAGGPAGKRAAGGLASARSCGGGGVYEKQGLTMVLRSDARTSAV